MSITVTKLWCGKCTENRRTVTQDCRQPNFHIWASTVCAPKREQCTTFLVASTTVMPVYRNVATLWTMATLQQITRVGYSVEVVCECQIDKDILAHQPELKHHPIVQHNTLKTRGGRTEAMALHYKIREGETIQHYDVMSLSIHMYFNFPLEHHKIHVGDAIQDKQATLRNDGLIKCTILTPILPFLCNNLSFCLCKKWAVECKFQGECMHE
jgi:hypothetical protein